MRQEGQDFFDWTDLCRALAALLVAVSHARDVLMIDYPRQEAWLPFYALTGFGHSGVILFFVLSGFWISRSVLRRIDDRGFWPTYLIDRLSRLGIVLLPALLLGGALDALGMSVLHLPIYGGLSGAHSLTRNVTGLLTWPVFLGNLAFLQTIAVLPLGSNGPLWSLAYEFWFYIWFPPLALLVRRRRLSWGLLALAIGAANTGLYWGFVSWLVGLVLLWRVSAPKPAPVERGLAWLAGLQFALVLVITAMIHQGWDDLPLALSFGLLLLALARTAMPFPRYLTAVARFGQRSSFSLYAIHYPIVALVGGWIAQRGRLVPDTWSLLLVLALTGFCVLAGWLFSSGTEAFTPALRGWLRQRLLHVAPAGATRGEAA